MYGEYTHLILMAMIILFTPSMPDSILFLFDSIIVRIAVVLVLLYMISSDYMSGLMALLMFGSLFLERNRRKILLARKMVDKMDPYASDKMTVEEEGKSQKTVKVLPFYTPDLEVISYEPKRDMGSNDFHPVDESINHKKPLETISLGNKSADMYEHDGFGHLLH
jgi:hypothetical protein